MDPFEHNSTHRLPKEDRDRMASQNTGDVEPESTAVDKPSSISPGVSEEIASSSMQAPWIHYLPDPATFFEASSALQAPWITFPPDLTTFFPRPSLIPLSDLYDDGGQRGASGSYTAAKNPSSISSGASETFASSSRQDQSSRVLTDVTSVGTMFNDFDAKVCDSHLGH